jgi:quercetin dioxygenase-like cupin family protein
MKKATTLQRTDSGISLRTRTARALTEPQDSIRPAIQADARTRFGPGGGVYRIVTTAKESQGRHFAFEAIEPPGGGPPLHTHANEDEYFLVLEGEMTFYIDGRRITAKRGESAFVPRGLRHCFKNCSTREARVLVLFTPGNIEGFFDYGLPVNGAVPSVEHLIKRLTELGPQYGLELIGPSPL